MRRSALSPRVIESLERNNADIELTLKILNAWNDGKYRDIRPVEAREIPPPDGKTILDMERLEDYTVPEEQARISFRRLLPELDPASFGIPDGNGGLRFSRNILEELGVLLYPYLSYGVLNGGSATSYVDTKKNRDFDDKLFSILEPDFQKASLLAGGRPKGLTPAYNNPDGSPGYSFLELKMRSLLLGVLRYRRAASKIPVLAHGRTAPLAPMFQMTSVFTDREVADAFGEYRESPLLRDLIAETGIDITQVETGVQPLIAAFTHSSEGETKNIFTRSGGTEDEILSLPGGHGQNFLVLKDVYRHLYESGKRFVYLGNVDNIGFTPDPVGLAILALSGRQAGFDFSFRTAVDVKGGILVVDRNGRLNCADIGPAISPEEVRSAEASGKPILFNVATGLFDLDYLAGNIDAVIDGLPMRWSDQDKDAGRYSQAEQVTWEVLGLLDDILVFGVNKYRRFLAAKLLLENLMTSGIGFDDPDFPADPAPGKNLKELAEKLHEGFVWNMKHSYGMTLSGGRWIPEKAE